MGCKKNYPPASRRLGDSRHSAEPSDLLDLDQFPFSSSEKDHARNGDTSFCYNDRQKYTRCSPMQIVGHKVGKGNLKDPKPKEVDPCRRSAISGTIECIDQHHAHSKKDIAHTDDAQSTNSRFYN